jgi:hypothetical protein
VQALSKATKVPPGRFIRRLPFPSSGLTKVAEEFTPWLVEPTTVPV